MNEKKVILVGAFHEIIELCEESNIEIIGIIDNHKTGKYWGYKILGTDFDAIELYKSYKMYPVVIIPDGGSNREYLVNIYKKIGFNFCNIISPEATISRTAAIGTGVIIQRGVNISANVKIGDFIKLNSFCNIMHDTVISDFVTIAPNALLLGRVLVGHNAYIGANATILPGIQIGKYSIVGAGAVITKSTLPNMVYAGVPGKQLSKGDV